MGADVQTTAELRRTASSSDHCPHLRGGQHAQHTAPAIHRASHRRHRNGAGGSRRRRRRLTRSGRCADRGRPPRRVDPSRPGRRPPVLEDRGHRRCPRRTADDRHRRHQVGWRSHQPRAARHAGVQPVHRRGRTRRGWRPADTGWDLRHRPRRRLSVPSMASTPRSRASVARFATSPSRASTSRASQVPTSPSPAAANVRVAGNDAGSPCPLRCAEPRLEFHARHRQRDPRCARLHRGLRRRRIHAGRGAQRHRHHGHRRVRRDHREQW